MPTNTEKIKGAKVGGECLRPIEDNNKLNHKRIMGTKRNATDVASNNNVTTTNNVVTINNIKVVDMFRTKYDNNVVIQVDKTFIGYDENHNEINDSNRFTISPLRFIKECNKFDNNIQMVYAICDKSLGVDLLVKIAKLVLLNSTISIKRTFVPKGIEENQDEDKWHTDIIGCSNSTNVLTVLPLIQMLLVMKPKQENNILNAFNI